MHISLYMFAGHMNNVPAPGGGGGGIVSWEKE